MSLPFLTFCDKDGKIYSHPFLRIAVSALGRFIQPQPESIVKLPQGSSIFFLPGRLAVGFNPRLNQFEEVTEFEGRKVFAAAAFLIPAYLRLHIPAYTISQNAVLPFWAYGPCGFYAGKFYTTAQRIDLRVRQAPRFYDNKLIAGKVNLFLRRNPKNRLYRHLANCALNHNCLAAKNLFLERWEAPLPTSRSCNAKCLGCLSLQADRCLSSHQRINFSPSVEEITQVMRGHLTTAPEAIASFGQGCEGEPLLYAGTIAKAVEAVRKLTGRGTINVNTNASLPAEVERLCRAGVDSFRVSLNSANEELYGIYFRPAGYNFKDIIKSIAIAKKYKKFVSVNLFMFPGVTDAESEISSFISFVKNTGVDMLQCRNLNIDPSLYLKNIPYKNLQPLGMRFFIHTLRRRFPRLKIGYFNLPKENFTSFRNVIK